ncbi:MAG: MOSC domain-containing protein [Gemmatimonadota bacterium]
MGKFVARLPKPERVWERIAEARADGPDQRRFGVAIAHIFTSPGHDFKGRHGLPRENHGVESHDRVECVAGKGLVGDRYFGFEDQYKGQITFFSAEVVRKAREHFGLPSFSPSVFRRNVIVERVDLQALVGREFTVGGVRFFGSEECSPCYWMDQALVPGTEEFLRGRGGLRARILTSGTLTRGQAELILFSASSGQRERARTVQPPARASHVERRQP